MFNVGGAELLVILLVALLVLGPNKLPQAARQVGHFLGEFRRIADGFQSELKSAMDDPVATATKTGRGTKPVSPGGPTERVIDADSTDVGSTEAGAADERSTTDRDDESLDRADGTADGTWSGEPSGGERGGGDGTAEDVTAADER